MGGIIERQKELRQRRHRKKKLKVFKRRLAKATASERAIDRFIIVGEGGCNESEAAT